MNPIIQELDDGLRQAIRDYTNVNDQIAQGARFMYEIPRFRFCPIYDWFLRNNNLLFEYVRTQITLSGVRNLQPNPSIDTNDLHMVRNFLRVHVAFLRRVANDDPVGWYRILTAQPPVAAAGPMLRLVFYPDMDLSQAAGLLAHLMRISWSLPVWDNDMPVTSPEWTELARDQELTWFAETLLTGEALPRELAARAVRDADVLQPGNTGYQYLQIARNVVYSITNSKALFGKDFTNTLQGMLRHPAYYYSQQDVTPPAPYLNAPFWEANNDGEDEWDDLDLHHQVTVYQTLQEIKEWMNFMNYAGPSPIEAARLIPSEAYRFLPELVGFDGREPQNIPEVPAGKRGDWIRLRTSLTNLMNVAQMSYHWGMETPDTIRDQIKWIRGAGRAYNGLGAPLNLNLRALQDEVDRRQRLLILQHAREEWEIRTAGLSADEIQAIIDADKATLVPEGEFNGFEPPQPPQGVELPVDQRQDDDIECVWCCNLLQRPGEGDDPRREPRATMPCAAQHVVGSVCYERARRTWIGVPDNPTVGRWAVMRCPLCNERLLPEQPPPAGCNINRSPRQY